MESSKLYNNEINMASIRKMDIKQTVPVSVWAMFLKTERSLSQRWAPLLPQQKKTRQDNETPDCLYEDDTGPETD